MVFSSLVFLWIFLPLCIIGYYLIRKEYRNTLLLVASLIFYAWGEPIYILLMLLSILVNFFLGLWMEKCKKAGGCSADSDAGPVSATGTENSVKLEKAEKPVVQGGAYSAKCVLVIAIIFNLGLLGYYKYAGFLVESLNAVIPGSPLTKPEVTLPIGISFFTFQILSYVIDLYRGEYEAQHSITDLALYISFFPQLIAGPIVKYKDINDQLKDRVCSTEKFVAGARRFAYGLGKKVLIANAMAYVVDKIYSYGIERLNSPLVWGATIAYTLQIYYDFSGYSDMAIGLGKIFGFEFQENFLYPYGSTSIQEFWRRWHVSLSSWLREYVYIPLGGNRKGNVRTYVNLIVVFFVTGIWHGAGWTFILWGLYHGFFSIIERLGLGKLLKRFKPLGLVYTLIVVNFGWMLFRADTLAQAKLFLKIMLVPGEFTGGNGIQSLFDNKIMFLIMAGFIGSGWLQGTCAKYAPGLVKRWKLSWLEMIWCALIMILSIAALASNTYNPFIYFRF